MKRYVLLIFIAISCICAHAQVTLWQEMQSDTYQESLDADSSMIVPESWDANLDSLLNSWHVKHYTRKTQNPGYQENIQACDSVYVSRLACLPRIMELPYNDVVRNCIDLYVDRRRNMVEYMLGLENFYFPMIEQALDENGLPLELKYLAVVESALNPTALSRAGASGLWQFMLPTGKMYGLEINSLVDERRDPLKATYAACKYFKDMYAVYGDWNLVIAAYNCGPGNVNKAIKRAGGKTDYWAIYPYLPKETRLYVPFFIAANYAMNYYAQHQLYPVQTELPTSTDTVMIDRQIHFDQISEVLGIEKEQLRALNPQYKKDIIPGNLSKSYALKLPALHAYNFVGLVDSISNHRANELFANRTYVGKNSGNNKEKVTHKVTKGETLVSIGNKYGVTASNIRKWNGLKSNKVASGRRLTLYVDNGGYASANTSSDSNKPTVSEKSTASTKVEVKNKTKTKSVLSENSKSYGRYKVKSGDSYYTIAKKFPGYTPSDLMKLNNTKNSSLKVGQYINVPEV